MNFHETVIELLAQMPRARLNLEDAINLKRKFDQRREVEKITDALMPEKI